MSQFWFGRQLLFFSEIDTLNDRITSLDVKADICTIVPLFEAYVAQIESDDSPLPCVIQNRFFEPASMPLTVHLP